MRFAEGWKEKGSRVGRRTQTRDQHTNVAFINARCTVGFAGTASAVRQPARQGQVFLSILLRSSPFSSCPFNLSADRCVPPFCAYLLPPPRLCTPTLLPVYPLSTAASTKLKYPENETLQGQVLRCGRFLFSFSLFFFSFLIDNCLIHLIFESCLIYENF